jgi:hypothetical protein
MHNSQDGIPVVAGFPGEGLLNTETASDICLFCHAENYGAVLAPDALAPAPEKGGGNFTFLTEDNISDAPDGLTLPIAGDHAGHSVVSNTYGLLPDQDFLVAPGGNFPASELGCTSCHGPHLQGTYRLLRSTGALENGYMFSYPAPQPASRLPSARNSPGTTRPTRQAGPTGAATVTARTTTAAGPVSNTPPIIRWVATS